MTLQLYNVWLQSAATREPPTDATAANIQQAGLLEQSGLVAEKVATESVDLTVRGQWHLGRPLPGKFATELKSLAASGYEGIPFFDTDGEDPKAGYYELASVDVNPDHQSNKIIYQYQFGLDEKGSHGTFWRATKTNVESVGTNLATGSGGLIALPTSASKVRWFDPANGTEAATVQSTAQGDAANFRFYDPDEPTFTNPMLLYEIPFADEYLGDVALYDDAGRSRELELLKQADSGASGFNYDGANFDTVNYAGVTETTQGVLQWVHVFHAGFEFDGRPVVDTGRLRVTFDESAGIIEAEQYDATLSDYQSVSIAHGDYELFDVDVLRVGPADTRLFTEWADTSDGSIDSVVLSFQRGREELVARIPDAESSVPTDLENLLSPIASDQTDDATPDQTLIRRSEVSGQVV